MGLSALFRRKPHERAGFELYGKAVGAWKTLQPGRAKSGSASRAARASARPRESRGGRGGALTGRGGRSMSAAECHLAAPRSTATRLID